MKKFQRRILHMVWSILRIIALVYVGFGVLLYLFQGRFIYFPMRKIEATPAQMGLSYEAVAFQASDGVNLSGWFLPAEPAAGVVLLCHGNAGNISHRLDTLRLLHQLNLSTFIFDYRGYGQSAGKPSERGTYLDAQAAWRYLVDQRGVRPEQIIVLGRSLGGAVAVHLAAEQTPGALIVESTFTSIPDLAAKIYPVYPVRLMARFRYDSLQCLPRVTCPVLVIHSRDDEMIPLAHGRRLFDAANEPKEFLELRGGHNDAFLVSQQQYLEALGRFISTHTGK